MKKNPNICLLSSFKSNRNLPKNLSGCDAAIFDSEFFRKFPSVNLHTFRRVFIDGALNIHKSFIRLEPIPTHNRNVATEELNIFRNLIRYFRQGQITLYEPTLLLTDSWSRNYFHWMTDVMQKLWICKKEGITGTIILPAWMRSIPYISGSLQLFDEYAVRYIRIFEVIKVKELLVPEPVAPTGNYHGQTIREVSEFIKRKVVDNKHETSQRLFIDRQDSRNRQIENYQEVSSLLSKYDIQPVKFEKLSWTEQIKLTGKAALLIGIHGAGLTNMLFMKPGGNLLELRKRGDNKNNCYFSLASALQLQYYYQLCVVDNPEKETQNINFIVDLTELRQNLELITKS